MKLCPLCQHSFSDPHLNRCPHDGNPLVDQNLGQGDPLVGTVVADRYEITGRVASGGMGTVYRARQRGLERDIALKVLRPELNLDQDTITRFHREARAMSLLTHPNTVRVFDFGGTPEGLLYLAMEFLEGELLTQRIARDGQLDPMATIELVLQILASLHEAHSKGIIHRDLKPDNIFLARVDGHSAPVVKVLDFGIAKIVHGDRRIDQLETQAGMVFGTPRYMSPEQAQGQALDARTDLYSVGVLAYHMLVGRPPYEDNDAVVVMAKHIRERALPMRVAAPGTRIPRPVEHAILRALAKDRDHRYASASDFAATLRSVSRQTTTGRRHFRRLVWAGLAGSAVLFLAALATAGYLLVSANRKNATPDSPPPTPNVGSAPQAVEAPVLSDTLTTRIESVPSGADLYVDGESVGTTPYEASEPAGTSINATLRRDGYSAERVEVPAGESRTVRMTRRRPRRARPRPPTKRRVPRAREERRRAASAAHAPATMTSRMSTRMATPSATKRAPTKRRPPPDRAPTPPISEDPYERW